MATTAALAKRMGIAQTQIGEAAKVLARSANMHGFVLPTNRDPAVERLFQMEAIAALLTAIASEPTPEPTAEGESVTEGRRAGRSKKHGSAE